MKSFCLLILIFSFSLYAKEGTSLPQLKVGGVNLPPFFIFDKFVKGKATGLAVSAVEKIYKGKYRLYWESIPLARGDFALRKKIIDVYSGYALSDRIKKLGLDHTSKPYFIISPGICGPSLKGHEAKKLIEIPKEMTEGKNLVFPLGSSILQILKNRGFKFQQLDYSGEYIKRAKKMITLGRTEFFTTPTITDFDELKNYPCINIEGKMDVYLSFEKGSPYLKETEKLMTSKER